MYQQIVAAIDESDSADRALEQAIEIAKLAGARLHLVHIVNLFELALEEYVISDKDKLAQMARQEGLRRLEDALARVGETGLAVESHVAECWGGGDEIAEVLLDCARRVGADLLVMGTHGRSGLLHLMLGSVAESVMRQSDIPLLTVRLPAGRHEQAGKRRLAL